MGIEPPEVVQPIGADAGAVALSVGRSALRRKIDACSTSPANRFSISGGWSTCSAWPARQIVTDELSAGVACSRSSRYRDRHADAAACRSGPLREQCATSRSTRQAGRALDAGGATELDRMILETPYDLLVHLIRNAIAHGWRPRERRLAGNLSGVIEPVPSARRDGRDHGGRRRPGRLREMLARRVARSFAECRLRRLSTAETATGLSGRGGGLDAVMRHVSLRWHAPGRASPVPGRP